MQSEFFESLLDISKQYGSLEALVRTHSTASADVANTVEALRFAIVLLASFPLSLVFRWGPAHPTFRHISSFISSSALTVWVFDWNAWNTLFVSAMMVWMLTKYQTAKPVLSFSFIFLILCYVQARVQLYPIKGMADFSSMIMVMIIKLTSYSYWFVAASHPSCYDGTRPRDKLDSYQLKHAIVEQPGVVEFLGYSFNLVGFWVGPALEFSHYRAFTQSQMPYTRNHKEVWIPALKCLLAGVAMMVLYESFNKTWHFSHCASHRFLYEMTFWQRIGYIMISGIVVRAKFHGAWKIAESSALISGMGYGIGDNGKSRVDLAENINIIGVELGSSPKTIMDAWNKKTANWLRRYVYVRVRVRSLRLPVTFLVSAVWHGFYPGYYTTFLSSVLMTEAARLMRKTLHPVISQSTYRNVKPVYDFLGWVLSMFALNYLVVSFILRQADSVWKAWSSIYFAGHIMFLLPFALKELGLARFTRRLHPKEEPVRLKEE
ncbi:Lysophospholipid acyltransferase 1 [Kappamyces sp. JEL0680]|nr:Lysophospholipid acyltransferase 1 [Kappamyces sp. JEL0680]